MYRNSLTPSKLFGLVLLLFSGTTMSMWATGLATSETPAFDARGLILLGLGAGLLILSLLFFRRVRWVRVAMSVLMHLLGLALLATLLYTLPTIETTVEHVVVVAFTLLGVGLLLVAILILHGTAMRSDFAAAPVRTARPRWRRYLVVTAAGMLLLLVLATWQVVPLLVAEPTITVDYLSQANQANQPTNYDPNQNAAPHYERFLRQFTPPPETLKDKAKSWPLDLTADEFKALQEWAPVNESVLPALAQAGRCPYWWYELKSADGALSGIQVPDRDRIRDCAWGILLLAEYDATQGDVDRALRLLTDLHMLGVHQASGGTLVEQLTGVAICGLSYEGVLALLDHCDVASDTLRSVLDAFAIRVPTIAVPRFSEMEHLYERDNIQRAFTDDGNGNGRLVPEQLYQVKKNRVKLYTYPIPYLDALRICVTHPDRQATLQLAELYFTFVKDLAKQTPWQLHAKHSSHDQEIRRLFDANYYLQDSHAGIGPCIRIGWRNRATGEAAVAVLAVFVFKAQEDRLPRSLQQLTEKGLLSSAPMDPYSGDPLVYKVSGDSFALYSVGEDFVDDGGVPCEWNDESGGDHVFWPTPAAHQ